MGNDKCFNWVKSGFVFLGTVSTPKAFGVETVPMLAEAHFTQLKQGVNEKGSGQDWQRLKYPP